MNYPKWATPERRAHLVELTQVTVNAYDVDLLTGKILNPLIEEVIEAWKAEDRATQSQLWQLEQRKLHALPQIRKRGPFGTIDREIYHAGRPLYRIVGMGVSAFSQHRIAQVEIPGLRCSIWVDLHGIRVGKDKLHKLVRYQRGAVPKQIAGEIEKRVLQAVKGLI
jgi:hypothetical protein